MIQWQWQLFDELSAGELYEILKARQEVFGVEQDCVYQDADDLDKSAWHLSGWNVEEHDSRCIHAYLRIVFPACKYTEPSIGRVITVKAARRTGLGRELMEHALRFIEKEYKGQGIRISAQLYLYEFYASFGFEKVSEPYDEDGILHIEMLKK